MHLPWSRRERRWRDALLSAALPPGDAHPGWASVDLDAFWHDYQRAAPAILRIGFRVSVWGLTLAPLAMGEHAPLHRLSAERRDAVVARLSSSDHDLVRQLVLATKLVASFAYFTDAGVRQGVVHVIVEDGASVSRRHRLEADVVVVGSGPAGSAVARELARAGADVLVLEEGGYTAPADYPVDTFRSMARMYRDLGGTLAVGRAPLPIVQGRTVGGTSVVNGAISWRLPRDVHREWLAADPALEQALPWSALSPTFDALEDELGVAPTDPAVAGANNLLLARGAEAMGLEHRPIRRNVRGCRGLGRCMQGCPEGRKQSMDVTLLADAVAGSARVWSRARVDRVVRRRGRAIGVHATAAGGGRLDVRARSAVVLAASAVQTPAILQRSGLGGGAVGRGFQCHPGVAVAGHFAIPVRLWTGATQGHEVIGLRRDGLKFEALGYDMALLASRMGGLGATWSAALDRMAHQAHWGAAVRARAVGRVRATRTGAMVLYSLTPEDVRTVRRGVAVLGQMLLAAGAVHVEPGVVGFDPVVTDPVRMAAIEHQGPLAASAYSLAATHLFGTARMGSDRRKSAVGTDFQVHGVRGLYVADSSLFPSNTGVNPQTSILAVATLCGRHLAANRPAPRSGLRSQLRRRWRRT